MGDEKRSRKTLPVIFRIEEIQCSCGNAGEYNCRAVLYHELESITVAFRSSRREPGLQNGALVSVRWLPGTVQIHGAVQVAGLSLLNYPARQFQPINPKPFKAAPRTWSVDRHLIDCASGLWAVSPKELQQLLFSTVLARGGDLKPH
ncbi:MAG: hypothetical protein OEV23_02515 [Gallionella sp.]|nr:hypothetical protein [Gallionella sp.]